MRDKVTLWIDDVKSPDFPVDLICRNSVLSQTLLLFLKIKDLYIDHDLGLNKPTGAEILDNYFIGMEYQSEYLPERIFIISNNPVGRANMQGIIYRTELYYLGNEGEFILK